MQRKEENKGKRRTKKKKKKNRKDYAVESNRAGWLLPLICMIDQTYTSAYEVGRCGLRQVTRWLLSDGESTSHNSK